ncbi:hypothetical protein FWK35_00015952 [Aphis craccivora]|uniref:Uncharacterized protein n=1 Tax=Aphis craccivora TaxID=307492 RepID=A0A6G0YVE8_APHCR|nr:hypothetical protein FWK35_00015952 [Aphis craccivora]
MYHYILCPALQRENAPRADQNRVFCASPDVIGKPVSIAGRCRRMRRIWAFSRWTDYSMQFVYITHKNKFYTKNQFDLTLMRPLLISALGNHPFHQFGTNCKYNRGVNKYIPPSKRKFWVRSVIRFLRTEENRTAQMHRPGYVIYSNIQMSYDSVHVHNEEGQGRKSIMTEDVNDKFVFKISRFTILDNI